MFAEGRECNRSRPLTRIYLIIGQTFSRKSSSHVISERKLRDKLARLCMLSRRHALGSNACYGTHLSHVTSVG